MKKTAKVLFVIFCVCFVITPLIYASAGILSDTLQGVATFAGLETRYAQSPTFISQVIAQVVNYLLGLMGVVFAVLVIYGGWLWMTAGGNEEQVGKGKKYLTNSIIGLIIILGAYTITWFVTSQIARATNQITEYSTLDN